MFTKKEIAGIIIAALIMGFVIGWYEDINYSPIIFLIALLIILVNVIAKKIAAPHYCIKIEHKILGFQRFGFPERSKLKRPFPIGLVLPFIVALFSLGFIKMFTILQFDYENFKKKRALRKSGLYRYSEVNESDVGFTAAWGFWALILLSLIGYFAGMPELTKYPIYYGIWNLIPLGQLDGTKLFFGSFVHWLLLSIVYVVLTIITML